MGKNRLCRKEAWESEEQTQGEVNHLGGATESGHGMSISYEALSYGLFLFPTCFSKWITP